MPVKLRLRRQGRKKSAHYAIIVADSRSPRDGRAIAKIGTYNPVTHPAQVYIDHEAALKWLAVGAQPTNTVLSLLRHTGVTVKFALSKQGKSEEEAERVFSKWRADKDAKKKKKVISVDVHGRALEPLPENTKKVVKAKPADAEKAPEVTTPIAVAAEVAAEAVEEAVAVAEEVVAEAPAVVEEVAAAAEEVVADAPAAEEVVEAAAEEAEDKAAE